MLACQVRAAVRHFNVHNFIICDLRNSSRQHDMTENRATAGAQKRHIKLVHLRNRLRLTSVTSDGAAGLHNQRVSTSICEEMPDGNWLMPTLRL